MKVGLESHEGASTVYRVTVEAGGYLLAEWPQVTLSAGESWQAQATLPPTLKGQAVSANAYRSGEERPYRSARLAPEKEAGP